MKTLDSLIALLTLEKLDTNVFLGQNYEAPWGRVFGGQVLGQSLHAAYQTVPEDRIAHSMHAYFILGGDISIPIRYEVDAIRNGGSFTTRRVVAFQEDKAIFNMAASFQKKQEGIDHQITMPNLITPDKLLTSLEQIEEIKDSSPDMYRRMKALHPQVFTFKPIEKITSQFTKNTPPYSNFWVKTSEENASISTPMQHQLLAYASDYNLLNTATLPHNKYLDKKKTFFASLDHAMWFHRDFKIDDWLLYTIDSPSASNARGFTRGNIFDRNGVLVASVTQEGLIRSIA